MERTKENEHMLFVWIKSHPLIYLINGSANIFIIWAAYNCASQSKVKLRKIVIKLVGYIYITLI